MEPRAKLLLAVAVSFLLAAAGAYWFGRHDGAGDLKPEIAQLTTELETVRGTLAEKDVSIAELQAQVEAARVAREQLTSMNKLDLAVRAAIARNFGIAERYIAEAAEELSVSLEGQPAADTVRELAGLIPLDPRASDRELANLVEIISDLEGQLAAAPAI